MVTQSKAAWIVCALTLTLIANVLNLSSGFIVKTNGLVHAGEVLSAKAVIQITVFGAWSILHFIKTRDREDKKRVTAKSIIVAVLSNALLVFTTLGCFIGVELLPISDYVVFAFATPIATLLFNSLCCCLVRYRSDI